MPGEVRRELSEQAVRGLELLELERRLRDAPECAHARGVFFRLAEQLLADRSPTLVPRWRTLSGARPRWVFRMYPMRELLREQALAAVLLDPTDPGHAIYAMWKTTPRLSPLIRAETFMRHLAGRDPVRALAWLEQNRGMMCDYGGWRVEVTTRNGAVFHFVDEYAWIAHAQRGGVEGTLLRCGVTPRTAVELDGPYHGRLLLGWS